MNEFDEIFEQEEAAPDGDISVSGAENGDTQAVPENNNTKDGGENNRFANAVEWVCTIVFTAAAVLVVNLFLIRAITVDGTSMCNTLQNGDRVITTSFAYKPKFGDIVVIQADKLVNGDTGLYGEPIIKRVIGVAGDTIRFDIEEGEVYRNGKLLREDYIAGPSFVRYNGWVESGVDYVVPENCVFVLGDNRKVSHDSRDLKIIGFIDENYIMGKAFLRIYPLSELKWL